MNHCAATKPQTERIHQADEGVTLGEFLSALQKDIFQHYQGDVFSAEIELTATPDGVLQCQSGQKVHMSLTFFRAQVEAKSEH